MPIARFKHIVCAISGGVDSSVAALLLKSKGYRVTGLFMRNWDALDETGVCTADQDEEDAQYVCQKLQIPFHQVNFVKEYWHDVFSELLKQYQGGITPNPDILCNKHIKFDRLLRHSRDVLGADALATGHYARTDVGETILDRDWQSKPQLKLLQAVDSTKDQTFFLSQMSQHALQRTLFPIGDLTKGVVREIARGAGLERIVKRKESMGICFIGSRKFKPFIKEYLEPTPGNFVSLEDNKVVGTHEGYFIYTVGQKAKISGMKEKWYVVDKHPTSNEVIVVPNTNHPALYCETMLTGPVHWIREAPRQLLQEQMMDCHFRFQNTDPLVPCTLTMSSMGSVIVSLSQPLRAITPGQYAVFYLGDECLGGAVITKPGPSLFMLRNRQYRPVDGRASVKTHNSKS
ncbi:mitochondrial tRNA-specific 2-thiouridylase 1-like isoform X2 [Patiria miniata]|uniref:tRNA-5-taurinomethyluridine 2-sulfurtransferase n=1 Tax=Patiria miniata TaxID=46514 RepID=A0A913Z7M9_PATMI|nr:mitochondrial tRNA-specific 2-thiouridylase 1-like isoform X2 [Patiria miniata]